VHIVTVLPQLLDHHKALLDARAISPAVAQARGYSSTVMPGWLRQQGFSITVSALTPGLVIPVHDVHGDLAFHQYRPDTPRTRDGKPAKYELPAKARMVLDVPRSINGKLADPAVPLFVTESPLKADAAVSAGLTCIATFGVYGWRATNRRGGKTALPDFEYVALNGRTVYLVPDSDVATNPQVGNAVGRLGALLAGRGADVRYVYLPRPADGSKVGLDDYLAAAGTVDGLYNLADDEPPERPARITSPNPPATVQPQPPRLAAAPRILDVLADDAVALGVVGEWTVVATTYLVATSRLLDKQASLAVKGHSASGKSHAVATVLRLFPAEALVVYTAMSSLALVYSNEEYAHRTIVIYEATALREGDEDNMTAYMLRSLLSEGRLEYEVTTKGKDGDFTTKKIVKTGPTNLILTTTKVAIHGENETRMLSVTTDDSREQTGRVMAALADESERHVDIEQWQQLQRWLATAESRVTVPYAARLAELIPPVAVRLRRDFGTLLALIRAHAMLHQLNRERDAVGRIVASLNDYDIVRSIVADILAEGVATTVSPTVRETAETVSKLDQKDGVTASVIAHHLKLDKSAASRRLNAAAAGGYVQNLEDRRGRPGRWRPAAPLPEDSGLLPTVDRLQPIASPVATHDNHRTQQTWDTDTAGCTVAPSRDDKDDDDDDDWHLCLVEPDPLDTEDVGA
jgi:hypothetical protein